MKIGRRMFSKNAAIGVVAAPAITSKLAEEPNYARYPPTPRGLEGLVLDAARPNPLAEIKNAKRRDYNRSMSAIRTTHQNIQSRRHIAAQLDLNIESLKSVSLQHKAIMQQDINRRMNEELMSWKEKFLRQFGLDKHDVYDNESASPSY